MAIYEILAIISVLSTYLRANMCAKINHRSYFCPEVRICFFYTLVLSTLSETPIKNKTHNRLLLYFWGVHSKNEITNTIEQCVVFLYTDIFIILNLYMKFNS